uniref:Uncharacterized protein n=1 Tax=Romanomermis culicivorax TaxID=13658 RepID=A0A915JV89_ROMCU
MPYIIANRDVYSVQQFIFSTFDSLDCRRKAFNILKEALKFQLDYEDLDLNLQDESEIITFDQIQECAKYERKRSVFELPLLSNLHVIKNILMEPDAKNQIEREIARRIRENQHFVIPSKVSRILLNLNPDRKFPTKPFEMDNKKSTGNYLSTSSEQGNEKEKGDKGDVSSKPNLHIQSSSELDDLVSVSSQNLSSNTAESAVGYPISKNYVKSRSKNFFFNYFSVRRNSAASAR